MRTRTIAKAALLMSQGCDDSNYCTLDFNSSYLHIDVDGAEVLPEGLNAVVAHDFVCTILLPAPGVEYIDCDLRGDRSQLARVKLSPDGLGLEAVQIAMPRIPYSFTFAISTPEGIVFEGAAFPEVEDPALNPGSCDPGALALAHVEI